jgi:hypothetical protein
VANNPILLYDPDGQKILIWYNDNEDKKQSVEYTQGMKYEGNNEFVSKAITNLNRLSEGKFGKQMISELQGSDLSYYISLGDKNTASHDFSDSKQEDGILKTGANISWDGKSSIGLGHEMSHGFDAMNGYDIRPDPMNILPGDDVPVGEIRAVHMENILRTEQKMDLRTNYFYDSKGSPQGKPLVNQNGIETRFGYDYKNNPNVERNYGNGYGVRLKNVPFLSPSLKKR